MTTKLSTAGLVIGALLLPAAGYTADQPKQPMTEKAKENVGDAVVITTKVKTEFAKDKEVSAMNINVDTDNKGVVTLRGVVKSKAEADKAVAIAKATQGVTAVRSELQFAGATSASDSMAKSASADKGRSDQPVDDTLITTRVKARMATDKLVSATNISVKTVNGVVELSGTAKSKAEVDQALAIARGVDGVKSVKNDIKVGATAASAGSSMAKTSSAGAKSSDQPIDDTMITTRVKARMATDKLVDAMDISVKTVNGVVELTGTASSKAEANKAVAIARDVPDVKSVKNSIRVTSARDTMAKTSTTEPKRSDSPIDDSLITTRVKARMATDKQVSTMDIHVKTVNGVVELSGNAKSKAEAQQAVAIARGVDHVKSVKNEIQVK